MRFAPLLLLLLAAVAHGAAPCQIGEVGCCVTDADCDDGEPCNGDEACSVDTGTCLSGFPTDGVPCDDADACTQTDACLSGACVGTNPIVCTASDQCHDAGVCNPATGTCPNPTKANGTGCDDGNLCTQTDTCQAGVCVGANPIACTASDQCHDAGVCAPATGLCSNPAKTNGTTCNDGNSCTQTDTCQAGNCVGANPVVCPLSDQCHDAGVCAPATGLCSNPAKTNGTTCNDGDSCTQTDTCQAGVCVGANPVVCTASDQCHDAGVCAPATGICSNPAKTNGTTCNDGNSCTQTDTCQAGACVGANPVVCTAIDQCHDAGTCAPATGLCFNPAKANGSTCNDGNGCTQTDTCQAGACVGTNPVVCTASDQCHDAGVCAPATGLCSNPAKTNGTTCTDNNLCTQSDSCQAGVCVGTNPVVCTASDQCHDVGVCAPATGVCSDPAKPNGATCNDGNLCTQTDTCQGGSCFGTNPVVCTASDQCHDPGVCAPATGVCSDPAKPNGVGCTDNNLCTQSDTCQAGVCLGGNPVVCTASDQCHDAGVCAPATGTCSNPAKTDGTTCTDGNFCTQTDTCQAGTCVGANLVICTALDQCHDAGVCDPRTGDCSNPTTTEGKTCDDGSACTQLDLCQHGTCVGTNPVVCTAPDDCHTPGACNPTTGTCPILVLPDGTSCNDSDACTVDDRCQAGACSGKPLNCNDDVPCTLDRCDAGTCIHDPQNGRCDQGDCTHRTCEPGNPAADGLGCVGALVGEGEPCTDDGLACTDDICTAGSCVHTPVDARCATDEECSPGLCKPAQLSHDARGCVEDPSLVAGNTCAEDGIACTIDHCAAGVCAHDPVPSQSTCDPVQHAFERSTALAAAASSLQTDLGALLPLGTGDAALARLGSIGNQLTDAALGLAGRTAPASVVAAARTGGLPETTSQQRAKIALTDVRQTPSGLRAFQAELAAAQIQAGLSPDAGRPARRQTRDLLKGTISLKRELRRLTKTAGGFAR